MGVIVKVKPDFSNLAMPDGRSYSANQQCTLTDAEYAGLRPSIARCVTVFQSGVPDPDRSVTTPQSLAETLTAAKAYTTAQLSTTAAGLASRKSVVAVVTS